MSKRILILDDEMDSNITVEAVLQDNGYKVDSYEDPILALERIYADSFSSAPIENEELIKRVHQNNYRKLVAGSYCRFWYISQLSDLAPAKLVLI